ncbi:MAG: aldo/keto reductase [Firmicutes bacterium]|nr:aldo/keto reductase [Bacillota bacterium]
MQRRPLGRSGLTVPVIGLGTMMFGEKTGLGEARRIVDRALEAGVDLIDTADVYADGEAERMLGEILRGRRWRVLLATKGGRPTGLGQGLGRRYLHLAVEASLRRLRTDWIDLYQLHFWDPSVPLDESLETLDALVRQGKIRYVGVSNWAAWQLALGLGRAEARGWQRPVAVQARYNLVYRQAEEELLPLCAHEGVGLLAYSPLAGGILTGKYLEGIPQGSRAWQNPTWQERRLTPRAQAAARAVCEAAARTGWTPGQVALAWLLGREEVSSALVGPRTLAQWEEALAAAELRLPEAERSALSAQAER